MLTIKDKEVMYQHGYYLNNKNYLQYKKRVNYFENRDRYRDSAKQWRKNNLEQARAGQRKWLQNNKEKRNAYLRKRYNDPNNWERLKAYQIDWQSKNKDRVCSYRERARLKRKMLKEIKMLNKIM